MALAVLVGQLTYGLIRVCWAWLCRPPAALRGKISWALRGNLAGVLVVFLVHPLTNAALLPEHHALRGRPGVGGAAVYASAIFLLGMLSFVYVGLPPFFADMALCVILAVRWSECRAVRIFTQTSRPLWQYLS